MKYSFLPLCVFLFLIGFQPVIAQQCQYLDSSFCYINKKYVPGPIQLELKSADIIGKFAWKAQLTFADITGDCYPEVLVFSGPSIFVLDPGTGDTLFSVPTQLGSINGQTIAIADVDNDQITELFFPIEREYNPPIHGRIFCMNLDGTTRWVSDDYHIDWNRRQCTGNVGLADFNQDGIPEVYVGNRIFNARTGVKLVDGGDFGIGAGWRFGVSVAAQLDNDPSDLELAAGYTIYKVHITNPDGLAGNTMTPYNILVDGKYRDGPTAIGDINNDGILDVVVHSGESPQLDSRVYVYTFVNGTLTLLAKATPPINPLNNSKITNIPAIGSISISEFPSILIVREAQLFSYQYSGMINLTEQWKFPLNEKSAGSRIVLFDLNGDGLTEIINQDQTDLRIIDGSSNIPMVIASTPCPLWTEYGGPITGDVLNNGTSQICVTCSDGMAANSKARVKVFGSPDSLPPWVPGRKVWNQYAYHINNINDDLTIPAVQKNNATDLNGRYNSFMEQQSLLDTNGYYRQRAAGMYGEIGCINYDPTTQQYTISFDLHNRTDASLSLPVGIPVAFYDGNPLAGGNLLGVYLTTQSIAAGESLLDLTFSFTSPPLTQLHMVVNTDLSVLSGVDEDDFHIPECDYTDNFSLTTDLAMALPDTVMSGTCDPLQVGVYTDTLSNQHGCDSIVVRMITMLPSDETNVSLQTCDPAQVGTDTLWLQNAEGCDSLVMTTRTLSPSYFIEVTIDTCDQTQAGQDTLVLQSIFGCDSIVVRTILYTGQYQKTNHALICGTGANYTDTLIVSGGPCDSLIITEYTYAPLDTTWLSGTTCDPAQTGITIAVQPSSLGCDSTIVTTTSLSPSDSTLLAGVTCDPAEAIINVTVLSNQFGCDSIVTTDIQYVGIDTLYVAKTTCEPSQVGTIVSVLPGTDCDTVLVTETTYVPFTQSEETIILCGQSGILTDTLYLQNSAGCDSLAIRFYEYAIMTTKVDIEDETCAGDQDGQISITSVTGSYPPYEVKLNSGSWQSAFYFFPLPPGQYTLFVRNGAGCLDTLTGLVITPGATVAIDAGPDRIVAPGEVIDLSAQTTQSLAQVQWTASDPLSCPVCLQTTLGPLTTNQTVVVTGWTQEGCSDSDALEVIIKTRGNIFIPNSFTPNGDGINDVFSIYGNDQINRIKNLAIFDRWGNALYTRSDLPINDPSAGWDGTFRDDVMDPGVYIYVVEVEIIDGSVKLYKGDVTLTR